ncbi:MAG TPA: glycosyltransferase family 39 protein, partial [Vicinamibacterales bacterium]
MALHLAVAGALLWWSWRKWADPLVDFGRELYVPWQITQGRVLYRDLASLFGPLSPYVNAGWFSIFGVSLTTLVVCNVAILMAMTAGIHRLLAISTDRVTATVATLTILLVCGFSQYIDVGNYNFVTPYAHEATHGVALSVAAFVALHQGFSRGRREWFLGAGACFGAVVLTKPEVAIAAGAGLLAGAGAMWLGSSNRRYWKGILAFLIGAAILPAGFLAYFHATGAVSWRGAAR